MKENDRDHDRDDLEELLRHLEEAAQADDHEFVEDVSAGPPSEQRERPSPFAAWRDQKKEDQIDIT